MTPSPFFKPVCLASSSLNASTLPETVCILDITLPKKSCKTYNLQMWMHIHEEMVDPVFVTGVNVHVWSVYLRLQGFLSLQEEVGIYRLPEADQVDLHQQLSPVAHIQEHRVSCISPVGDTQSTLISISPSRRVGKGVDVCRDSEPSVVLWCTLIMLLAEKSSTGHWRMRVEGSRDTARRNAHTAVTQPNDI